MIINTTNKQITFALEEKSFANISIHPHHIKLELIETVQKYRNANYATNLLHKILAYLKEHFPLKMIYLNPLPLDRFGLNLEQLINFYKKFGFTESIKRDMHAPFLMERVLN